jgi:hypothetical protein
MRARPVFWLAFILPCPGLPVRTEHRAQWRLGSVVRLTAAGTAPDWAESYFRRHRLPVSASGRKAGGHLRMLAFYNEVSAGRAEMPAWVWKPG